MNPKQTVCEGNVNWGNLAQNGINCQPICRLIFHFRVPYKELLGKGTNFSCSEITFTYTDMLHFVNIQMEDICNNMQPVKLALLA